MLTSEIVRQNLVLTIRNEMANDQAFLEWAILEIDARQTDDERDTATTKHQNGRGWAYNDAQFGGYLANFIRTSRHPEGRRLSGEWPRKANAMMKKYAGQILRVAAAAIPANVAA